MCVGGGVGWGRRVRPRIPGVVVCVYRVGGGRPCKDMKNLVIGSVYVCVDGKA